MPSCSGCASAAGSQAARSRSKSVGGKGARQPTRFDFVINLITARALALTASSSRCSAARRRRGEPLGAMTRLGVWLVVQKIADRVRKVPPHGAWLWRLKPNRERAD
jgi:hypothetical protein